MTELTHVVLLFAVFFMILYLFYRWVEQKREESAGESAKEGLATMQYPRPGAFLQSDDLPLKEYAIKASFNSAYDGNKVSLEQLGKTIYRGCRFIDLNVFSTDADHLYVGFSNDNSPTMVDVSLPFPDVITYLNAYAFQIDIDAKKAVEQESVDRFIQSQISPEMANGKSIQDNMVNTPLFLNLRIYRSPKSTADIIGAIYSQIQGLQFRHIDETGKNAVRIHPYTRLGELRRKILITMDIENILQIYTSPPPYDPNNVPVETRKTIGKMVNAYTGGENWSTFYKYADVEKNSLQKLARRDTELSKPSYETNAMNMKIAYPYYTESNNPDAYDYIMNHIIQTIPFRYYRADKELKKYNALFDDNKTPFLPLYHAMTYIRSVNPEKTK